MSQVLEAGLPARWGRWQRTKNTLIYAGVRLAYAVFRALPFVVTRAVGAALGAVASVVDRRDRRRALAHLAAAFPERSEAERRRVVYEMFVHLGVSAAEMVHVERFITGRDKLALSASARATLDEALAEGRGVVAVGGHTGNWELLVHVFAATGLPVTSIAKPLYDPRLTRFVNRMRTAYGHRILWRGDDDVSKELLRVFRSNGILGLLIDQDTRVQGAFVPFFGRPAHTPTAAAGLALRHGAAVIMVGSHRRHGRHELFVERLPLPPGDDREARVVTLTAQMTAWIEAAIRRAPEQWVWLHDRWRRQPGDPGTAGAP